jgi:hypothetical protein
MDLSNLQESESCEFKEVQVKLAKMAYRLLPIPDPRPSLIHLSILDVLVLLDIKKHPFRQKYPKRYFFATFL